VELIESEPHEVGPLPEPEPRYPAAETASKEDGQTWVNTLATILIGIILVVLIVLFARWVYHKVHDNNNATENTGTLNVTNESNNTKKQPAANTGPSSGNPGSSRSTPSATPGTENPSGQLPNNGPGDVAAVFAGASAAGAAAHYAVSRRRYNHRT